ncbi:MAG: hypothetical protein V8S92_01695 [Oscillospiraceae bacterium]
MQIILIILAGLSIVLPSLSCVAVTQFHKENTVYLYPVIGAALRLLNVPAQQKPVCKDV